MKCAADVSSLTKRAICAACTCLRLGVTSDWALIHCIPITAPLTPHQDQSIPEYSVNDIFINPEKLHGDFDFWLGRSSSSQHPLYVNLSFCLRRFVDKS